MEAVAQGLELPAPDWRSARVAIERIAWAFPEWEKTLEADLSSVRYAVVRGLASPQSPEALAEAVQLASVVGNAQLARACLRLLPREASRPRLYEDAIVREHAVRTVARWGTDQDRVALEVWLERALCQEGDASHRLALERQIEDLRFAPTAGP